MIELSDDAAISARARLAQALTELVEADARVHRCRRLDFADDGGVHMVVELGRGADPLTVEVVARELEFALARALPRLPWVRVQPTLDGSPNR